MKNNVDIWFDFSNPPHVNLFRPMYEYFKHRGYDCFSTSREFVETSGLLEKYNIPYASYGKHGGKNRASKALNLLIRNFLLLKKVPQYKISISSSFEAPQVSWLRNSHSIIFDDNELAPNWLYGPFIRTVFAPSVIPLEKWARNGINPKKVIPYEGYKEDIYIADYVPDLAFPDSLPFKNYILLRPENIFAAYVPKNVSSIVPELVKQLTSKGYNILYLPRYEIDYEYVDQQDNIYIPDFPVNGLDASYFSTAVLTGAGTFAREAAILGKTAISFYAGNSLLSVDQSLVEKGLMLHTRNPDEIIEYLSGKLPQRGSSGFESSKKVKEAVFREIETILNTQN